MEKVRTIKPSRYYQKWLQLVSRGSDVLLFLMGWTLGKEMFVISMCFLGVKILVGFTVSELMYKRMQAVVKEKGE